MDVTSELLEVLGGVTILTIYTTASCLAALWVVPATKSTVKENGHGRGRERAREFCTRMKISLD